MLEKNIGYRTKCLGTIASLILFAVCFTYGQSVELKATLDTTFIRIGEQTTLNVKVNQPAGKVIRLPFKDYGSDKIEVLSQSEIDTLSENGQTYLAASLKITSFDSGAHQLPLIVMLEEGNQMRLDTFLSPVLSVATVTVDTSQVFMPIKGQMTAHYAFKDIWNIVLLVWLVMMLGIGIYIWLKKAENKATEQVDLGPKIPAYALALQQLDSLESLELWQAGKVKTYYIQLTDIVRNYLEGQFHIPAMESTTDEIMDRVKEAPMVDKAKMDLREMLELADLVKFAKQKPGPDAHVNSIVFARNFVNATKPEQEEVPQEIDKETNSEETLVEGNKQQNLS